MSTGSLNDITELPLDFLLLPGDGLLLLDEGGLVTWLDRRAEHILGARADDWLGRPLLDQWPALAAELQRQRLEEGHLDLILASPDHSGDLPLRLFRSDHGIGIALVQHPTVASDDQPLVQLLCGVINTVQDALLITLAEPLDSPGPIIIYVNPSLLQQTGYQRHELLGRSPRLFQGQDTDHTVTRRFGEGLRRWQQPHMEVVNYTREGLPYWV